MAWLHGCIAVGPLRLDLFLNLGDHYHQQSRAPRLGADPTDSSHGILSKFRAMTEEARLGVAVRFGFPKDIGVLPMWGSLGMLSRSTTALSLPGFLGTAPVTVRTVRRSARQFSRALFHNGAALCAVTWPLTTKSLFYAVSCDSWDIDTCQGEHMSARYRYIVILRANETVSFPPELSYNSQQVIIPTRHEAINQTTKAKKVPLPCVQCHQTSPALPIPCQSPNVADFLNVSAQTGGAF